MRLSCVGALERVGDAVLLHQAQPRHRVELAQHHDAPAERVCEHGERQRTGVVERSGGEVHGRIAEHPQRLEHREHGGGVGCRAHRALRLAGGARRVDHRGAAARAGFGRGGVVLGELGVGFQLDRGVEVEAAVGDLTAVDEHGPHLGQLLAHRGDEGRLLGVDDHDHGVGVVDDVLHLVRGEPVRHRHRGHLRLAGRVEQRDDLERVGSAPGDAIAAGCAQREQGAGKAVRHRLELGVGRGRRTGTARGVDDHCRPRAGPGVFAARVLRQEIHERIGSLPA